MTGDDEIVRNAQQTVASVTNLQNAGLISFEVNLEIKHILMGDQKFIGVYLTDPIEDVFRHPFGKSQPNLMYRVVLLRLFFNMISRKRHFSRRSALKSILQKKSVWKIAAKQVLPALVHQPFLSRLRATAKDSRLEAKFQGCSEYRPVYQRVFMAGVFLAMFSAIVVLTSSIWYSTTQITTLGTNILNAFEIIYFNWALLNNGARRLQTVCKSANCLTTSKGIQKMVQGWAANRMKNVYTTPTAFTVKDPLDAYANLTWTAHPINASFYSFWQREVNQIYLVNGSYPSLAASAQTLETIYANYRPRLFSTIFDELIKQQTDASDLRLWLVGGVLGAVIIWAAIVFYYNNRFYNSMCSTIQYFDFDFYTGKNFGFFLDSTQTPGHASLRTVQRPSEINHHIATKKFIWGSYVESTPILRTASVLTGFFLIVLGVYVLTIQQISVTVVRPFDIRFSIQKVIFSLAVQANQMLNPATNITISSAEFFETLNYYLNLVERPESFPLPNQPAFAAFANTNICGTSYMADYPDCAQTFRGVVGQGLRPVFAYMQNIVDSQPGPSGSGAPDPAFITLLLKIGVYIRSISLYVQTQGGLLLLPLWSLASNAIFLLVAVGLAAGVAVASLVFHSNTSEVAAVLRIMNLVDQAHAFSNSNVRALINHIF